MSQMKVKYFQILAVLTLALIVSVGVFSFTAFASTGDVSNNDKNLIVNAAWLDGEMIRLDVTDSQTGTNSSLAVPLRDYLKDGDNSEFISVQAVDGNDKQSGIVEVKNPFYNPNLAESEKKTTENKDATTSAISNPKENTDLRPLTPNGAGSVVDNANSIDGKEFFTINSVDGNEFFLIVDRQKNSENVYFLNAVTEEDLMSLAQKGGRDVANGGNNGTNAIPTPTPTSPTETTDGENPSGTAKPESTQNERPTPLNMIGNNLLIFGAVIAVVGGLAYYLKVVKPRNQGYDDNGEDDEPDEFGYDEANDDETPEEDEERRDFH